MFRLSRFSRSGFDCCSILIRRSTHRLFGDFPSSPDFRYFDRFPSFFFVVLLLYLFLNLIPASKHRALVVFMFFPIHFGALFIAYTVHEVRTWTFYIYHTFVQACDNAWFCSNHENTHTTSSLSYSSSALSLSIYHKNRTATRAYAVAVPLVYAEHSNIQHANAPPTNTRLRSSVNHGYVVIQPL